MRFRLATAAALVLAALAAAVWTPAAFGAPLQGLSDSIRQRLFDDDDWQLNPEYRQELTPEHRRFMCNLSMLDGVYGDRLDLIVTRGEEDMQGTAGLPSLVGYGAIGATMPEPPCWWPRPSRW